ncbi:MAG: hypothetical protein K8R73_07935 [Clostridiales bacterium]|nr:hypothetical protein [Clostridiales bacterium]
MNSNTEGKQTARVKKVSKSKNYTDPQCRICRTNYGSISFKEELICESCVDYIKNSL